MSMGTKLPSGMFNTGYTQPYGSGSAANMYGGGYGGGTYDPMLGFGQSSGMGTTYDYPTRYSADYTRYAQSGQPFNQPVMGYNTYGQIFAQPQRPPPTMGGKGGSKFQPQPPSMGGKGGGGFGGYDPNRRMQANPGFDTPFGNFPQPRRPERRTNQLGLNQPPKDTGVPGSFLDFYSRQNNPANSIFEPRTGGPGATHPPLTGGVPTDSIGGFGPGQLMSDSWSRRRLNPDDFQPLVQPQPVQADRQVIDENIYNSPFGQLIAQPAQQAGGVFASNLNNPAYQQQMAFQQGNSEGETRNRIQRELNDAFTTGQRSGVPLSDLYRQQDELSNKLYGQYGLKPVGTVTMSASRPSVEGGLGGMPTGGPQIRADYEPIGGRNFDMLPTVAPDNYIPRFGNMRYFQEGGQVPPDANMEMMMAETAQPEMAGEYDRLIQMTMQAILGQVESPDEVIQMFIDEFGVDAFRQLREAVLKQQVPNAQTEGMVDGNGGGMDDQVMGMIGNQRPVAVSPGEYIVPADVVSGLGDGSSKSGADILDELNQAVRMARTGTTQQPRPLMETMQ